MAGDLASDYDEIGRVLVCRAKVEEALRTIVTPSPFASAGRHR